MKKAICSLVLIAGAVLLSLGMKVGAGSKAAYGASSDSSRKTQVEVKDFAFQPPTLTVPAGTRVIWVNHDEEPHTVVSTGKAFTSKALDTNDQLSYAFDKPGTYEYFCSIHPRMVGKIVVQGADTESSPHR